MYKKISILLLLALSVSLVGCKGNEEEKEDMYLAGYIVDITDDEVSVISSQGEFKFDITDCVIESEDELQLDDSCEVYYSDELDEETVIKANKIVPYFDGYLIGNISNIDGDEFTITSEGTSYKFKLDSSCDVKLDELDLNELYDVEFDKKLSSKDVNIAQDLKLLEVDEAPVEELDLVENFNGTIED